MSSVLTRRRVLAAVIVIVLLLVAWILWTAWRTEQELRKAERSVSDLRAALERGDVEARDDAVAELTDAAASARNNTDGLMWGALTHVPVYGDDAAGVEALSASLDALASGAVQPLIATVDSLDGLVGEARIDTAALAQLGEPVRRAHAALASARAVVDEQDSDGFVDALKTRYSDYVDEVADLEEGMASAETAVSVLPDMLGADGPRDYLFVFQNNAEIRSTGGLPGSWARIHVDNGALEMREQGSASDFLADEPVAPLTDEEVAVYDRLPTIFFQDPNFIPDFPRAAELFDAFWRTKYPATALDGVVSLDPVAMSYLMAGTGPIQADGVTLTADNLVDELLSSTYLTIADPAEQDLHFQRVARAVFEATTRELASPVDFIEGLARAARERRFLVAPFVDDEAARLDGTAVLGQLSGDDGATPHVDIGVNDGTGSKMSYYLRYRASVVARSCEKGVQRLNGSMSLSQTVSESAARGLPDYVTGGSSSGIQAGSQLVTLRIYGPYGGTIENARIDGKQVEPEYGLSIGGRPVVTLGPLIDSPDPVVVTWEMSSGPGQTADGATGVTPSIVPGTTSSSFESSC